MLYVNPLKTRVFGPKIEFRDENASFTPQNSELFWQEPTPYPIAIPFGQRPLVPELGSPTRCLSPREGRNIRKKLP